VVREARWDDDDDDDDDEQGEAEINAKVYIVKPNQTNNTNEPRAGERRPLK
jgi:hypothetical protein